MFVVAKLLTPLPYVVSVINGYETIAIVVMSHWLLLLK
ncbi:hypothetical protein CO98_1505 [Staphylococcus aureus subsp. aureus CO-98]|nr:hypothetical protein CO98_1505 [Staphylococcus aureus subsp. aureus CO-98]